MPSAYGTIIRQQEFEVCRTILVCPQRELRHFFPLRITHPHRQSLIIHYFHLIPLLPESNHSTHHLLSWTINAPIGHHLEFCLSLLLPRSTPSAIALIIVGIIVFTSHSTEPKTGLYLQRAIRSCHKFILQIAVFPTFRPVLFWRDALSALHLHASQRTSCLVIHHIQATLFLVQVRQHQVQRTDTELTRRRVVQPFAHQHIMSDRQRETRLRPSPHRQVLWLPFHIQRIECHHHLLLVNHITRQQQLTPACLQFLATSVFSHRHRSLFAVPKTDVHRIGTVCQKATYPTHIHRWLKHLVQCTPQCVLTLGVCHIL